MVDVSVPCGACGKPIRGGDDFCEQCGAKVGAELKSALRERLEASDSEFAAHRKQLRNAGATIGILSMVFVVSGIVFFFVAQSQVDEALGKLGFAPDSAQLAEPVAGATTFGEARRALERQPWQVLGLNLFLAVVMLGLWIWSKKSILPAIMTALGIYVAVIVANALYDPTSLAQGLLIKIAVVLALAKGVHSTLAARKLEIAR